MLKYKADILFPVNSPPVPDGILLTDDAGKIHDVLNPAKTDYEITDVLSLNGFLCPGFINTHAHTELSHLRNQVSPSKGLNSFILEIQDKRNINHEIILENIRKSDETLREEGVVAVTDICNTGISFNIKAQSKLYYHNLIELFGSDPKYAKQICNRASDLLNEAENLGLNASLTPHSFYAVSSALLKLILNHAASENSIISLHHLESQEEISYFYNKTGTVVSRMDCFNVDISGFKPSGKTPLLTYAHFLPPYVNKLLVHNTYVTENDVRFAQNELPNVWWCLCPNSNLFIESGLPDIPMLINNNCKLTVGTDSLASNTRLNILFELFTLQKVFNISTQKLLEMATLNGAQFMKLDSLLGSFEKNKTPGIVHITNTDTLNIRLTENSEAYRLL